LWAFARAAAEPRDAVNSILLIAAEFTPPTTPPPPGGRGGRGQMVADSFSILVVGQ
jgi:hypothetical protein